MPDKDFSVLSSSSCVWGENGQIQLPEGREREKWPRAGAKRCSRDVTALENDKGDKMTRGCGTVSDCAIKQLSLHLIQVEIQEEFGLDCWNAVFDHLAARDTDVTAAATPRSSRRGRGLRGSHRTWGCSLSSGRQCQAPEEQQMQGGGSALRRGLRGKDE